MAVVEMASVAMPGGTIGRGYVKVSPSLFFAMQGTKVSDGTLETWVSRGEPNLGASTHTGAVVLGSWSQL